MEVPHRRLSLAQAWLSKQEEINDSQCKEPGLSHLVPGRLEIDCSWDMLGQVTVVGMIWSE